MRVFDIVFYTMFFFSALAILWMRAKELFIGHYSLTMPVLSLKTKLQLSAEMALLMLVIFVIGISCLFHPAGRGQMGQAPATSLTDEPE
jgi:hypothetical protein